LEFRGERRFLSNFWMDGPLRVSLRDVLPDAPLGFKAIQTHVVEVHDGALTGPSVEHVFQAAKVGAEHMCDQVDRMLAILAAPQPGDAKRMGGAVRPLRAKFAPGTELADLLAATGYRMLVEGNDWGDRTWGAIWMRPRAAADGRLAVWGRDAERDNVLAGENWLGRLLMLVRAELDCGVRG
jgi:predicted NAD-dependent protein-ADP-ribosyltransferase YbiA (DUF1768 family)